MEELFLYLQIADEIRKDIMTKRYKPGDRLPSIRQLCKEWKCTPGTIQRAYHELSQEGLLVSHAGRGTQVVGVIPHSVEQSQGPLRHANLVHRMEAMLLEALTIGYNLNEIQQAMELALDRWRALDEVKVEQPKEILRFVGSHDMVMNGLARQFFRDHAPQVRFQLAYSGSLGGLTALAEGKADFAGCHLWDAQSKTYNIPYIRRILPGQVVTIVTLAHRRVGLIVAPGNPHKIQSIADLTQPWLRFVNRQPGSGTRVWLDEALSSFGIDPRQIQGYTDERLTHSDVARAVAEGNADVGLGLETAALAYGLDFHFLIRERYDLVMLTETSRKPVMQNLLGWLASEEGKQFIARYPGYEKDETGNVVIGV